MHVVCCNSANTGRLVPRHLHHGAIDCACEVAAQSVATRKFASITNVAKKES